MWKKVTTKVYCGAPKHTGITHYKTSTTKERREKISVLQSQRMWYTACQSMNLALTYPQLTSQHDGLLYCSVDCIVRKWQVRRFMGGFVFVQTLLMCPRIFPSRTKRHIDRILVSQMVILPLISPTSWFKANLDLFPPWTRSHQIKEDISCQKANVLHSLEELKITYFVLSFHALQLKIIRYNQLRLPGIVFTHVRGELLMSHHNINIYTMVGVHDA